MLVIVPLDHHHQPQTCRPCSLFPSILRHSGPRTCTAQSKVLGLTYTDLVDLVDTGRLVQLPCSLQLASEYLRRAIRVSYRQVDVILTYGCRSLIAPTRRTSSVSKSLSQEPLYLLEIIQNRYNKNLKCRSLFLSWPIPKIETTREEQYIIPF